MTRANVIVYDDNKPLIKLYIHSDGYPSGLGRIIASKFQDFRLVDGISSGMTNIANGMGDFAVQLITWLKNSSLDAQRITDKELGEFFVRKMGMPYEPKFTNEAGYAYIEPLNSTDEFIDYKYIISNSEDNITMEIFDYDNKSLFRGTMKECLEYAERSEE